MCAAYDSITHGTVERYGKGGGGSNAQWDKVRQADRWTDKWMDSWTVGQPLSCLSVTVIVCPGK